MTRGRPAPGLGRFRARLAQQQARERDAAGLYYRADFLQPDDRAQILSWLATLHPIWEMRYSLQRPPPQGETQRRLLRPVYWLGNWQFACLDYYRPPNGTRDRCVRAEPFPPVLARIARHAEAVARRMFLDRDVPEGWTLNTCLVNFYGRRRDGEAWVDTARVGEHKDFEPGPVASLSLGERALFQFVDSRKPGEREGVVAQQWLDDGSLQIFGGERWKKRTFHRVQRVDKRARVTFPPELPDFETRRVNFTFRYVPEADIVPFARLGAVAREDVRAYVSELAQHSAFWAETAAAERSAL